MICLDPAELEFRDPARWEDLPAGTRVLGVPDPPLAVERVEKAVVRLRAGLRRASTDGARNATPRTGAGELRSDVTHVDEKVEGIRRDAIGNRSGEARVLYRAYRAVTTRLRQQRWARRAVRVGRRQAVTTPYRAIISCGPPHSEHPAARRIAAAAEVPFVMEMRDPWSLAERVDESLASPLWFRLVERAGRKYQARRMLNALKEIASVDAGGR